MNVLNVFLGFGGFLSILFGLYLANLNGTVFEARPLISLLIMGFFGMMSLIVGYAFGAHLVKIQVAEEDTTTEE